MVSGSLKVFLCVLLSASSAADNNAAVFFSPTTVKPRTFIHFGESGRDEPISYCDEDSELNNCSSGGTPEKVLAFLTGPVSTIFLPSFYTLVCSISLPINICAVLAIAWGIRPKKPAVIYMLNLGVADLLFAMLLPFKISYHFQGNNWKFGSVICRVVTAVFYWNMYCSVLLITCISVDRLLAVVYPIKSLTWRSPQKAVIACIVMWILSIAGSVPLITSKQTFEIDELNITTCHDVHSSENILWLKTYFLTLCCTLFLLPLLITVVSYTRVIWALSSGQHRLPGSSRRRTRAVVMAVTVLVIFVLCFMPTNCLLLAHYLQLNERDKKSQEAADGSYALYLVFLCLGSLNCLLDPLLYYFGSSQCRRQLSNMLKIIKNSNISHSSSDSCSFFTGKILKSSRTESTEINPSVTKVDSVKGNLNSQNKTSSR